VIIDRLGSKISLGAALLGWSVAQTASGLINTFSAFIGLRIVLGIGEAPMFPSAAKALSEWFEAEKRGTPTGIVLSSTCIGPCIAPPLLTLLMVNWGWRGMFIATGVFGIVIAACWFAFYKSKERFLAELPAEERERLLATQAQRQAAVTAIPSVKAQLSAWAELFQHKSTWGAVLGFMGVIYMLWLHLTWLPGYFEREHGLSLYQTAWIVSLAYVFGALGTIVAGRFCDRLVKNGATVLGSRKLVVVCALFSAAAFTIPLSLGSGFILSVVLLCGALFSVNMASSTAWMIAN
ncbi:MFS transporter, partial [Pseudomonas kurunegalensis]